MAMRKDFRNKTYTLHNWYARKQDALRAAKQLRAGGKWSIRVTEDASGWYVWIREKPLYGKFYRG